MNCVLNSGELVKDYVERIANLNDEEFRKFWRTEGKHKDLFLTESIYEFRCRKMLPASILKYRGEMLWMHFNLRITRLFEEYEENKDSIANTLCKKNRLLELKVLNKLYYVLPDVEGANILASTGKLSTLEYLAKYNILPDSKGLQLAIDNSHKFVIEFLTAHGIVV